MSGTFGLITIGQSPREDITSDLAVLLPIAGSVSATPVERGLLDPLSPEEILRLAPAGDDFPLVTRLRDGTSVVLGKEKLLPLLEKVVRSLERECDVILLLCSGPFPEIPSRAPILYPSRLLEHFVRGLAPPSATVLVPHEGQVAPALGHWGAFIENVTARVATPYPWRCPADLPGGLVIMDCLGYSLAMKEEVRRKTGGRAVLVRSVAAAALRELLY